MMRFLLSEKSEESGACASLMSKVSLLFNLCFVEKLRAKFIPATREFKSIETSRRDARASGAKIFGFLGSLETSPSPNHSPSPDTDSFILSANTFQLLSNFHLTTESYCQPAVRKSVPSCVTCEHDRSLDEQGQKLAFRQLRGFFII